MKAVLVMFKADGKRREFPLKPGTHTIGRQRTCKLRVPLPSVSRRHAELVVTEAGEVTVRDLGSSNGTFRNGTRVEEARLEPGDELRIGPLDLILADADEAESGGGAGGAGGAAPVVEAATLDPSAGSSPGAPGGGLPPLDGSGGGFLLDDPGDDPLLGGSGGASGSVSSANPLDASGSASAMAIELEGEDDPLGSDDSHNTAAAPPRAAPAVDDDEEDLDDLLANFGKSEGDDDGDDDEFDFLADVEILDDDEDLK